MSGEEEGVTGDCSVAASSYYSKLSLRFVLITVACSVVPLLIVGWAINLYYARSAELHMMENFRAQAEHHRRIIELFLDERSAGIQLIARTHSLDYLSERGNLHRVFETMNHEYDESFTDLGVIDEFGKHVAYIGPYDLKERDYSRSFWFKSVMEQGVYVSDMFLGFRKVPHFIIAVAGTDPENRWVLRATIDTEALRSLVEDVRIGSTGEVYLVNEEGVFQTAPRFGGKIMERTPLDPAPPHDGIRVRILEAGQSGPRQGLPRQIAARAWLRRPHWMLIVKQDLSEALYDVNRTNRAMLILLHLSAVTILAVSIFTARHMIKVIRRRDEDAEKLNRQLLQASKLAAVGELSAGVAHEINNPLAIIMTERQLLLDAVERGRNLEPELSDQLSSSLTQIQTQLRKCKRITQDLLRFSRRTKSVIEEIDLNALLGEIVQLMEREAGSSGVRFSTDLEPGLPQMLSDPSQLQQVFLNLITNAIDAHEGKPYGSIRISTRLGDGGESVVVGVADAGSGIRPEHLDKVFDPFFTTKPVGKGTGLGLSLCYSMVEKLGGAITVESESGEGTEFTIALPLKPDKVSDESRRYRK
jgi:two-component system, NtrC family, sensor kinase